MVNTHWGDGEKITVGEEREPSSSIIHVFHGTSFHSLSTFKNIPKLICHKDGGNESQDFK
jgi:hypothetical protein